jgi:hypothetical protein
MEWAADFLSLSLSLSIDIGSDRRMTFEMAGCCNLHPKSVATIM